MRARCIAICLANTIPRVRFLALMLSLFIPQCQATILEIYWTWIKVVSGCGVGSGNGSGMSSGCSSGSGSVGIYPAEIIAM